MKTMKTAMQICCVLLFGVFLASGSFAADEAAIKGNVDGIAAGIGSGKAPADYKPGDYDPYVFIMEEGGMVIVHPSLVGQSLNTDKFKPVYDALAKATADGVWVEYTWKGAQKKSYVKKPPAAWSLVAVTPKSNNRASYR
jgi:hypothetical protein